MKRLGIILSLLAVLACRGAESPLAGTSFERESDLRHFSGSVFEIATDHTQFGSRSLKWGGGELTVSGIRSLSPDESGAKYGSHFPCSPTFVMSLYNETPMKDPLRIEFNGKVYFDLNLNFKGWRTVWVPYHEMQGEAPAPGTPYDVRDARLVAAGTLWLDDIVFCQYIDERHPYPGLEVPFIKGGGAHIHDHWMPKIPHWNMLAELPVPSISATQEAELSEVADRLRTAFFKKPARPHGADYFNADFNFNIPLKLDKQVDPIGYEQPGFMTLRTFGKLMRQLANEYLSTGDAELSDLFASASEYYLDQGWAAGSSQGTAHHIGYSTRELHTAFFLMRDPLDKAGLLESIGDSVRWQLNFGETLDPDHLESNLDYYNTQSVFRLMASFLTRDPARQSALLSAYSCHLSAALALTSSQGFRPDGTAWHHYGHYPAYATGAFDRIPVSLKALSGTSYRIGEAGHANFKRAFMAATIYSNPFYYGLGQAGRHPLGGDISKLKEACLSLALSGTPDGSKAVDAKVASAYARLWGDPGVDCTLDPSPTNGHWTFPYAALSVHRRADWSVNIKGFSSYVWASEIYNTDNRYGRYQSSGVVQILPNMTPEEAGYTEAGWDWNHPPGATTIERPFTELEPKKPLVMFKSVETYAGGCVLDGNGVWAMKLNEADGYTIDPVKEKMSFPGNLKARKSVFCFGDQLLCLGSGIEADDPSGPVHTTLFQSGIKQIDDTIYSNGQGLFLDPIGNGYQILDDSRVVVTVGRQWSPNNKFSLWTGKGNKSALPSASGIFAKAWIDHGSVPENESYAYAVYPQVGSADFLALENRIAEFPVLEILRQDNAAHIIVNSESKTIAYACFEAGPLEDEVLKSVSVPCYVMIRKDGEGLTMTVVNPDLNQDYDAARGNYYGDSGEAPVTLMLDGVWKVKGDAEAWTAYERDSTILTVKCIDGKSMVVDLEKSDDQAVFEEAKPLDRQSPLIAKVTEDRIGLRHMWMKSARYTNFDVSILED